MGMEREPMHIIEAIQTIQKTIEINGSRYPEESPEALPVDSLCTMVGLFQRRELVGRMAEDERHIAVLRKAIGSNPERPKFLDPITVWWGGDRWYVIDGHHRRQAYKIAQVSVPVPVEVIECSLEDALKKAAESNSKDRLRMTKEDKMTSAWCLTVLGKHSKAEVVRACAVGDGSVATMRRTMNKLRTMTDPATDEAYTDNDLLQMSWEKARDAARGELECGPKERDEIAERHKRALSYSRRMHRYFGDRHVRDVEAFAEALSIADVTIPQRYVETDVWQDALEEVTLGAPRDAVRSLITGLIEADGRRGGEHQEALEMLKAFAEDYWDIEDNPDY